MTEEILAWGAEGVRKNHMNSVQGLCEPMRMFIS